MPNKTKKNEIRKTQERSFSRLRIRGSQVRILPGVPFSQQFRGIEKCLFSNSHLNSHLEFQFSCFIGNVLSEVSTQTRNFGQKILASLETIDGRESICLISPNFSPLPAKHAKYTKIRKRKNNLFSPCFNFRVLRVFRGQYLLIQN